MYIHLFIWLYIYTYAICIWICVSTVIHDVYIFDHLVLPQGSQVYSPRQSHSKDSAGCNSWWNHLRWRTPPGCSECTKVYNDRVYRRKIAMKKWRLIPHILGRCHWENDDQTWDGGTLDPIPGFHRACDSEQPIIIPQLLPHQRPAMDNRWHWQEQLKGEDSTTGESHMIPSDLQIWHGLTSTLQHVVLRYLESKNGRRPKNSKIHSQNQSNCCSTMGFVWALYFPNKSIFFCSIIVQRIICPRPPRGSRSFCPPRPFRGDVSPMGPAYQRGSIYIPWELSPTMVLLEFFSPKVLYKPNHKQ